MLWPSSLQFLPLLLLLCINSTPNCAGAPIKMLYYDISQIISSNQRGRTTSVVGTILQLIYQLAGKFAQIDE